MLISTNILRDDALEFNYIPTANTQRIFTQIEGAVGKSVSCFNLIGSYGTGKSSFLLALESTLEGKSQFFRVEGKRGSSLFIKIIGEPKSLRESMASVLGCGSGQEELISALKEKASAYDALFLLVDEFGKCLEYAISHDPKNETYFLQVLAEAINDSENNIVFVSTLHQNFDAYSTGASGADALEWEKVSGRFTAINFNEPPETLVRLAAQRIPSTLHEDVSPKLNFTLKDTGLLPLGFTTALESDKINTSPFDYLTAFVTVSLLQRYGQNERSLFTFLNAGGDHTLNKLKKGEPYLLHNIYDYALDRLGHAIYSPHNPDKLQWESAERAIQRADYHDDIDPAYSHPILKSILLINLFTREKGEFNLEVAFKYLRDALGNTAVETLEKLAEKSIIQYLRYKNKLVFVEGTDVNIQAELIAAYRRIPAELDMESELNRLVSLKPALAKRHYLLTGTPRFAEFYVDSEKFSLALQQRDGNCRVLLATKRDFELDPETSSSMYMSCVLGSTKTLVNLIKDVLAHEVVVEKYDKDFGVKQIVQRELNHAIDAFEIAFKTLLFEGSTWYDYEGKKLVIQSEHDFNKVLSSAFTEYYNEAPIIKNELINKAKLSASINSGRRNLVRVLLNRYEDPSLGFVPKKYPAEKSIFNSVFVNEGMYNYESGVLSAPKKSSSYQPLWKACLNFMEDSRQGRRGLQELIEILKQKPYGFKDGVLRIWLMVFLVAEEENYALYYLPEDKFLPYFSDDIFENILKKPEEFAVKRYNYDKLPLALLEEYRKNSVYLNNTTSASARSTYFKLYGELLTKFKNLPKFTLRTNSRLSKEARSFRKAVIGARDPEDCLTAQIPNALGFSDLGSMDKEQIQAYFSAIRKVEAELGQCYEQLLEEVFEKLCESIGYSRESTLEELKGYFIQLKAGVDLNTLNKETRVLLQRLTSPLDIRDSWIKSVADVILGTNIDAIEDGQMSTFFRSLSSKIDDLISACQINSEGGENRFIMKFVLPNGEVISRTLDKKSYNDEELAIKSQKIQALANKLLEELTND